MGNQQSSSSRSATPTSNPQSPSNATASHGPKERPPHPHVAHIPHHAARRRESIPALSTVKSQAAPPSASFENAESHHPTSTRPHSRGRSQTVATSTAVLANNLRAATDVKPTSSPSFSHDTMGNEQSKAPSKEKGSGHGSFPRGDEGTLTTTSTTSTTGSTPPQPQSRPATSTPEKVRQAQPPPPEPAYVPSPQTRPVDVPATARDEALGSSTSRTEALTSASLDPADASQQEYMVSSSNFSRPPRLPLPIEEENHQPGSPILSSPIDHDEVEGALPRHNMSMLSTTTADDEDLGEEFKGPGAGRPTVPTLIEWEGPGERVYVTGTFAGWNRKYKLHRNGPSKKKDALSAYIHITPGTHHLAFLVDNDMRTSDKLPTAVDYTNILVNYIEVSYDDVLKPAPAPAHAPAQRTDKQKLDAATPVQDREKPAGIYPPQVMPGTPEIQPVKAPLPEPQKPKVPEPTKKYHQNIPRYLLDLDAPEESSRFARANATTNNLPTPPTLPGFLGKSILNGQTPHKDDSSVLIMPNHTVLNHLATSSIKDNILATSATTRYKQKFLTTIMYKPKEEHGEQY